MKRVNILILSLFVSIGLSAQINDGEKIIVGTKHTIQSSVLNENRKISIYTPASMKPGDQYPVLYVLDGEAQHTMVTGQVQYLSEIYKTIPSLIIVSIENTDRTRDMTPTHFNIGPDGKEDTSARAFGRTSGGGDKFLQFINDELFPFIEKNYPTAPYRIFTGHSLGGLIAMHALVSRPEMFNAYIAISPSLQWDREVMLRMVSNMKGKTLSNRILFFSDGSEGGVFHSNQLRLDSILKSLNINGLSYRYIPYPQESHVTVPVKAFYDGIRFVYPEWHLAYNNNTFRQQGSAKMVKDHFSNLSIRYGYPVIPIQEDINTVARFFRNDPKRIADAIELLEWNAVNFPKSARVLELLGETYEKKGETKLAITSYEKALHIDSNNDSVKARLNKLKG